MEDSGETPPSSDNPSPPDRPQLPESTKGEEVPWLSAPRLIDHPWMTITEWKKRVEQNATLPDRHAAQLVFLGDSITEGWTEVASRVWNDVFGAYRPLRLGIGGDQTQNILWRMDHGELAGLTPKVLVLLIGVNNIWWGGFGPDDTARGIAVVAEKLCEKLPHTKVFIQAIFPAGRRSQDELRLRIVATNRATQPLLKHIKNVTFLDIGNVFLSPDGSIDQKIMHDYLHLTEKGYALWASALSKAVESYL